MSVLRRRVLHLVVVVALLGAGAALAVLGGDAAPRRQIDREITLAARGMAFYLPGDPTPNPTLVLRAGERVRLTLRNDEPGIAHDLVAGTLGVAIPPLLRNLTTASVELGIPREAGRHAYVCSLHPQMMRGEILIVP